MARAMSSLPVPLSPTMQTLALVAATFVTTARTSSIFLDFPMIVSEQAAPAWAARRRTKGNPMHSAATCLKSHPNSVGLEGRATLRHRARLENGSTRAGAGGSGEHTAEIQSLAFLVFRLLL